MEKFLNIGAELRQRQLPVIVNLSCAEVGAARIACYDRLLGNEQLTLDESAAANNALEKLTFGGSGEMKFSGRQSEQLFYACLRRAEFLALQRMHEDSARLVNIAQALKAAR